MSRLAASILWFSLFTGLFLLSQDFWSWNKKLTLGPANYPGWLFYFFFLQIILVIALIIFTLTHWKESIPEGNTPDNEQ